MMFISRRWAWMALALPSRSPDTVKAWSCTTPSFDFEVSTAVLVRLNSRVAIWPGVTVNESFTKL